MDVDRRSFLKFLGLSGAAAGVAVATAAATKVEKVIPEGKTGILKNLMGKKASLEEQKVDAIRDSVAEIQKLGVLEVDEDKLSGYMDSIGLEPGKIYTGTNDFISKMSFDRKPMESIDGMYREMQYGGRTPGMGAPPGEQQAMEDCVAWCDSQNALLNQKKNWDGQDHLRKLMMENPVAVLSAANRISLEGTVLSLEEKRAKDHERWLTFDKMKATVNPTRFAKKSA